MSKSLTDGDAVEKARNTAGRAAIFRNEELNMTAPVAGLLFTLGEAKGNLCSI
jgi:hypothetical protein